MVGAPVSYPGSQAQLLPAAGTNPTAKYAPPPSQMYSTPSAPISVLLPYGGLNPSTSSAPFNTSYPNYPTVSSATAAYPPNTTATYPHNTPATYPPTSSYTPATYPPAASSVPPPFTGGYPIPAYLSPQPTPSYNPQAPSGYPTVGAGNYAPPASAYNPQATSQAPPYGAYWAPPPAGGSYSTPPPTAPFYPPQF